MEGAVGGTPGYLFPLVLFRLQPGGGCGLVHGRGVGPGPVQGLRLGQDSFDGFGFGIVEFP